MRRVAGIRGTVLPVLAAISIALAGCTAVGIRGPDNTDHPGAFSGEAFRGRRIAVSLPTWSGEGIREGGKGFVPPPDPDRRKAIQLAVVLAISDALEGRRIPAEVVSLPDLPDSGSVRAAAREQVCDLLIELRVKRYELTYREPAWLFFAPNTVVHYLFFAPAWVIPDENYGAALELEASCVDPEAGGEAIHTARPLLAETAGIFSEWGKGWTLWGTILNLPGSLEARNWRRIAERIEPSLLAWVRQWAGTDLLGAIEAPVERWHFGKRRALLVGVGRYSHNDKLDPLRDAHEQALDLDRVLHERHGVQEWNRVMLGKETTLPEFLQGISLLQARSRPRDSTLVYFGGRSAMLDFEGGHPEPAIFFHEADPETGAGILPVSRLLARLGKVHGRVVLVLDTDFSVSPEGEGQGRGVKFSLAPPAAWPPSPEPERITVIYACMPGQLAGGGHLGEAIIAGLDENPEIPGLWRADADGDRTIRWPEIVRFLLQSVLVRQKGAQVPFISPVRTAADTDLPEDWLTTAP